MWFFKFLSILGLLAITAVASAWITSTDDRISFFFTELTDYLEQGTDSDDAMWGTVSDEKASLIESGELEVKGYVPGKALEGVTLYSNHNNQAFVIDMDGKVLHKWQKPFSAVWPNPTHVSKEYYTDHAVHWSDARVLPNGDLLAVFVRPNIKPWGGGLVKLDKHSNVIWKYDGLVHHWVDISDTGYVFALEHEMADNKRNRYYKRRLASRYLDDSVVVLSLETGEVIKKISLLRAIEKSPYEKILRFHQRGKVDPLHANDVDYITEDMAKVFPYAKPGQLLISLKALTTLVALDLDKQEVVWAHIGPWNHQHDPTIMPNGNLLVFDNHGGKRSNENSAVFEYDPAKQKIVWEYTGTDETPLFTDVRGEVQPLENGNILITENRGGKLLEVTKNKEVVWEFVNPIHKDNGKSVGKINAGRRYKKQDLLFLTHGAGS